MSNTEKSNVYKYIIIGKIIYISNKKFVKTTNIYIILYHMNI